MVGGRCIILAALLLVYSLLIEVSTEEYAVSETDHEEESDYERRQLPTDIYPQLMVVVDASLAHKLGGKDTDIKTYIQRLIGNVQRVYDSVPQPKFHFTLADIYICKDMSDCSFINRNTVGAKLEVSNESFMKEYSIWAENTRGNMVSYDLMMTFTSLEMCRVVRDDGTCPRGVGLAGKAFLGGVCGNSNMGIAPDDGGFGGIKTIAHEMAHLFGAVHDGSAQGGERCEASHGYIMGGSGDPDNYYRLSPCSIRTIAKHISSSRRNCLRDNRPGKYELDHTLPGSLTSPDQQCKMKYGPQSKNCPFFGDLAKSLWIDAEICEKHWCYFPDTGTCRTAGSAFTGTPCDKHDSYKHCYMSYGCVDKDFRPPATDVDLSDMTDTVTPVTPVTPVRMRSTTRRLQTTTTVPRLRTTTTEPAACKDAHRTHLKITPSGIMTNCTENYRLYPRVFCGTSWVRQKCCATARDNCIDNYIIG